MDMPVTQINSDKSIPIEHHFRVSAGPGAGKTHWLVNHIKNVLHQSERLGKARKIACITYTNVAVDKILQRLGISADRIEVSTIHSFLYKHIVKPYAKFLVDDYGLNVQNMDGHDDKILSNYSFISKWKQRTNQQRIRDDRKIVDAFTKARWRFDGDSLTVKPDYPHEIDNYPIKKNSYFEYKKMAWEKGVVHYDDVLFFSYQLIQKSPFILQVLRAKFPYFFIDEFQDTNPIQTKILEQIGQEETIVGIIGDYAQSIYGFQGAKPSQFNSFKLPDMVDYQMADNRRSTNQIIDLLNTIRSDIRQNKHRNENGEKATIIVGEMNASLQRAQEICKGGDVYSLTRDNITSNAMKRSMNQSIPPNDLLQSLDDKDSNSERRKLMLTCIKATELARQKNFKEAIKVLERLFKDANDKNIGKKDALKFLTLLLKEYDSFQHGTLLGFYDFVNDKIKPATPLKKGNIKFFYENHKYTQLAVCVKNEDTGLHRTIHKAKGTEFDNVLLVLKNDDDLKFLLNPNMVDDEEHRIYYVAISRAKERLFISLPAINDDNKVKLGRLFNIISSETTTSK